MNVLLWHVHGSWATSFVQGPNDYIVPVTPDRGPDGRGRAQTWNWPASVRECAPEALAGEDVDVVILQRPEELTLLEDWTGWRPGLDVPVIYVEHNAPTDTAAHSRHPLAGNALIPIVHVTHFNRMYWDSGCARTHVIEHGIVDPGYRWTGEHARAVVVANEPVRRGRTLGADLITELSSAGPIDLFGAGTDGFHDAYGGDGTVHLAGDLPQDALHTEIARRRVYVHTSRWTSLGMSLLEAMHLGMPVVCVAGTEAPRAVPPGVGVVSNDVDELREAIATLIADEALAEDLGRKARTWVLDHYGLDSFLGSWQSLMEEMVA